MNTFIVITLVLIILFKIFELFFPNQKNNSLFSDVKFDITHVNAFIRNETRFEILKWMTTDRFQINASTGNPSIINQMTNSEEIKKKISVITNIIAEKISPELHKAFNKYYRKDLEIIDRKTNIDISLREYIGRYIFHMLRRLTYDITNLIESESLKAVKLNEILNEYIKTLEETIYFENNIYLIHKEQSNVSRTNV
jgi:hypothetical protein